MKKECRGAAPRGSSRLVVAQARDERKSPETATETSGQGGPPPRPWRDKSPCATDDEQNTDMAALLTNWGRRLQFIGGIEGRWAPPVTRETQRLGQSKHVGSY